MKIWKTAVQWYLGGMGYVGLELIWRGWSHGSMFLVGGCCFLLIVRSGGWRVHPLLRVGLCAGMITGVELISGLVLNRLLGLRIWDYGGVKWNLMGQICLPYFLLWHPVAALAMLYEKGINVIFFGAARRAAPGEAARRVIGRYIEAGP